MRSNDAQVLQVWTAAWSWKDSEDPCEYVFAKTEHDCVALLGKRLRLAETVLIKTGIVRKDRKLAASYTKSAKPRVMDVFDPEIRELSKELLPEFKGGLAVRSSDQYADLVECADLDLDTF